MNHHNHRDYIAIVRCAIPMILLCDLLAVTVYLVGRLHMLHDALADVLIFFGLLPATLIAACFYIQKVLMDRERRRIAKTMVPIAIGRLRIVQRQRPAQSVLEDFADRLEAHIEERRKNPIKLN